jgi:hypothetical protein
MGLFTPKDNTDIHATDQEDDAISIRVTFSDGTKKELRCAEWELDDGDNIAITQFGDEKKTIWLNERFVVSVEEL